MSSYLREATMKTILMTIDEDLLADVDRVIAELRTTRSAFIRSALSLALRQHRVQLLERRHAEGYARGPVAPGEFER
jgi:metal-responsive CopG/Arc/MetJ family transcriptional regulator